MTAKRKRLEALEEQRRTWEAAHPPAVAGLPTITPQELSGKTAEELADLYLRDGGKFAPPGEMPRSGEVIHPDTLNAMTAPELVRLYFQDRK